MNLSFSLPAIFVIIVCLPSAADGFICRDDELTKFIESFAESASQHDLYGKHELFLSDDADALGVFCRHMALNELMTALKANALQTPENAVLAADALINQSIVIFGDDGQPKWTGAGKSFADEMHQTALRYIDYARDRNYPPGFILKAQMYYEGIGVRESRLNAFDQLLSASQVADDREMQLEILEMMQVVNPNHAATNAYERQLFSGDTPEGSSAAQGSGFFVSPTAVLTAAHVVAGRDKITLLTSEAQTVAAKIELLDSANDLAVLRIVAGDASRTFLHLGALPGLGSEITVIGYPLSAVMGDEIRLTGGVVNALHGPDNDPRLLQISAGVQAGSSGSPVLDDSGNVIGVVISKLSDSFLKAAAGDNPQNINFAIKVTYALPLINMERDAASAGSLTRTEIVAKAEKSIVLILAE